MIIKRFWKQMITLGTAGIVSAMSVMPFMLFSPAMALQAQAAEEGEYFGGEGEVEILSMDELAITEDEGWLEDGETYIKQLKEKEKEEMEEDVIFTRIQTYLSSGVSSTVYKAAELHGIDVSHHQQWINWQQVKASGIDFAMIRVGYRGYQYGAIAKDTYFETNMQNALAAGVKVGIYFFSQAMTEQEAYEEACYTVNMIKQYNITYPVVFDWETAAGYRTSGVSFSKAQMNAMAAKFCDTVSSAGYIPMVYSNTVDFRDRYDYSSLAAKYYIWYARYLPEYGGTVWYQSGNRLPNFDNNYKFNIWQYMSDGTVPGVSGNCDVDVTFLDFATKTQTLVITEVKLQASTSKIKIDETSSTITGVTEGMTCDELRACFPNFFIGLNYGSSSSNGKDVLKTGDVLHFATKSSTQKLKNNKYTIYIMGDVNGDGGVSVLDMESVQKHLLGISTLNNISWKAANVTGSGELSVLDMEKIQKHLLGLDGLY